MQCPVELSQTSVVNGRKVILFCSYYKCIGNTTYHITNFVIRPSSDEVTIALSQAEATYKNQFIIFFHRVEGVFMFDSHSFMPGHEVLKSILQIVVE